MRPGTPDARASLVGWPRISRRRRAHTGLTTITPTKVARETIEFREEPFTLTWQVRSCSVPLPPRRRSGPFTHPYEGWGPARRGIRCTSTYKSRSITSTSRRANQQLEVLQPASGGPRLYYGCEEFDSYGGLAKATEPYNPSVSAFPGSLGAHAERGTEPRSPERSYARTAGRTPAAHTHAHCHGAHTGAGRGVRLVFWRCGRARRPFP